MSTTMSEHLQAALPEDAIDDKTLSSVTASSSIKQPVLKLRDISQSTNLLKRPYKLIEDDRTSGPVLKLRIPDSCIKSEVPAADSANLPIGTEELSIEKSLSMKMDQDSDGDKLTTFDEEKKDTEIKIKAEPKDPVDNDHSYSEAIMEPPTKKFKMTSLQDGDSGLSNTEHATPSTLSANDTSYESSEEDEFDMIIEKCNKYMNKSIKNPPTPIKFKEEPKDAENDDDLSNQSPEINREPPMEQLKASPPSKSDQSRQSSQDYPVPSTSGSTNNNSEADRSAREEEINRILEKYKKDKPSRKSHVQEENSLRFNPSLLRTYTRSNNSKSSDDSENQPVYDSEDDIDNKRNDNQPIHDRESVYDSEDDSDNLVITDSEDDIDNKRNDNQPIYDSEDDSDNLLITDSEDDIDNQPIHDGNNERNSVSGSESNLEDDERDELPANMDMNLALPSFQDEIDFDVNQMLKRNSPGRHIHNVNKDDLAREKRLTKECIQYLWNCLQTVPKDSIEKDPKGLRVPLMPHQRQALQWMKWRESLKPSGGILADDMGLGKTLQMISLVLSIENEKKKKRREQGLEEDTDSSSDSDGESDDEDWNLTRRRYKGKTLVVCPPNMLEQWDREIADKCKRRVFSSFIYHGVHRYVDPRRLARFDFVLTTYELLAREYEQQVLPKSERDSRIYQIDWERIVLDEAHKIRNFKCKFSIAVSELKAESRWALTGTPIHNKTDDLYALVRFLKCEPFDERKVWRRWVDNSSAMGDKRLFILMKCLMFRRTKAELISKKVVNNLPEKTTEVIEIELEPEERIIYYKLLLYSQSFFYEFLRQTNERRQREGKEPLKKNYRKSKSIIMEEVPQKLSKLLKILITHHKQVSQHDILVMILRLRQMCCHPALIHAMLDKEDVELADGEEGDQKNVFDKEIMEEINAIIEQEKEDGKEGDENDDDDDVGIDANLARNLMSYANPVFNNDRQGSKVKAILKTIEDIVNRGEKVVVVSQWVNFLNVIANNLEKKEGIKFGLYGGKTSPDDKLRMVDRLNEPRDKFNVMLLSLCAGGTGLTLVGANNLLLIDLHWNPQLETQAMDRVYRIGQKKEVHVYKFVCKNTVDERILKLQERKLKVANNVFRGTAASNAKNLTIEEMESLFS